MSRTVSADVERAAAILRAGGIVAFPTETVYGLGADAANPAAVARVFAAKGRPADHPLIVHLGDPGQLTAWAAEVPPEAERLAEVFWPGPLTLVLRRAPHVPDAVTGGRDTVGVRVPAQPLARALLNAFGGGIAAPSANRFGRVSPTTAEHVRTDLGDRVDLVLDGGPCAVGVESTIVEVAGPVPVLLRSGGVPVEVLEEALGKPVQRTWSGPARAPGMLPSHYAPDARVELVADAGSLAPRAAALLAAGHRVGVLAPAPPGDLPAGAVVLPPAGEPDAYARVVYDRLRLADHLGVRVLLAVPPPEVGIGAAVVDRLRRAAAAGDVP